jgi:hypothetical protein
VAFLIHWLFTTSYFLNQRNYKTQAMQTHALTRTRYFYSLNVKISHPTVQERTGLSLHMCYRFAVFSSLPHVYSKLGVILRSLYIDGYSRSKKVAVLNFHIYIHKTLERESTFQCCSGLYLYHSYLLCANDEIVVLSALCFIYLRDQVLSAKCFIRLIRCFTFLVETLSK